jgi:hypothetical protein
MGRAWASVLIVLSTVGCTGLEAARSDQAVSVTVFTVTTIPPGTAPPSASPILCLLDLTWTDNLHQLDPNAPALIPADILATTFPNGSPLAAGQTFFCGGHGVRSVRVKVMLPSGLPEGFQGRLTVTLKAAITGQVIQISTFTVTVDHTPPAFSGASTVRTDSSLAITVTLSDPASGIATVSVQPKVNGTATASLALSLVSGDGFSPTTYSGTLSGLNRLDVVGIDLTATDGAGDAIQVPGLPVAHNGGSELVECDSPSGANVLLDGSGSTGGDGTPLTYSWLGPFGSASGVSVSESLPFGSNTVTLLVGDERGIQGSETATITVGDAQPPSLSVEATPSCLWPPNNKLVALSLTSGLKVAASDTCDPSPKVRIVNVASSDGTPVSFNSEGTCVVARKDTTYTITVEASDSFGNTTQAQTTVVVPHSSTTGCTQPTLKSDDPACVF